MMVYVIHMNHSISYHVAFTITMCMRKQFVPGTLFPAPPLHLGTRLSHYEASSNKKLSSCYMYVAEAN